MKPNKKNAKFVRHEQFRINPVMNPLGTPSNKIEIYSKTIEGFGLKDCQPTQLGWLKMSGLVAQRRMS